MRVAFLSLGFLAFAAISKAETPASPSEPTGSSQKGGIDFAHEIAPLIREYCGACHTGEKRKGGLSMNSREELLEGGENGKIIEPGNSAKSKMLAAILSEDEDEKMPPPDSKQKPVSKESVEKLRAWIDAGAPWQDGFTFKKPSYEPPLKPRRPTLPTAKADSKNPVDTIINAYWQQHQVAKPAAISDGAFYRRASMDLVGLLPDSAKLEAFLADKRPDKRARLVDALLAQEVDYADHWLTFWNDLLRNDYSRLGYGPGSGEPITKWLYASLITNKPYDQFVRELIAPPTPDSAGFSAGLAWRGTVSASQRQEVQFSQSISQSFLGINMKCASCHDSFVDRWKLDDAYGLAAVIAKSPVIIHRCDKPVGRQAKPAWIFPELGQIDANAPQPERLKQLAGLMTHPQNGRFARTIVNRLWHRLMGRGIVHPVDAMQTEPWSADLLDQLGVELADHHYDLKYVLKLICNSQAYQSATVQIPKDEQPASYVFRGPIAKRMTAEEFVDAVWQLTGTAPTKMDAEIVRGRIADQDPAGRGLKAQWIWRTPPPIKQQAAAKDRREGGLPNPPASADPVDAAGSDGAKDGPNVPAAKTEPKSKAGGKPAKPEVPRVPAAPAAPAANVLVLRKTFTLKDAPKTGVAVIGRGQGVQVLVNDESIEDRQRLTRTESVTGVRLQPTLRKGENEIRLVADLSGKSKPQPGLPFHADIELADGSRVELNSDTSWEWTADVPRNQKKFSSKDIPNAKWLPVASVKAPVNPKLRPPYQAMLAFLQKPVSPVRASLVKSDLLQRALGRPNREQIVTSRPEELTMLEALDLTNGAILDRALEQGAKNLLAKPRPANSPLIEWLYASAVARKPTPQEVQVATELAGNPVTQQGLQDLLWSLCMLPEFQLIR